MEREHNSFEWILGRVAAQTISLALIAGPAICLEPGAAAQITQSPAAQTAPQRPSPAESRGIKGILVDGETGKVVTGAQLLLLGVVYDEKKQRSLSMNPAELKAFGEVITDRNGVFHFRNVPPGTYALTFLFQEIEQPGIRSVDIVVKENAPVLDLGKVTLKRKKL